MGGGGLPSLVAAPLPVGRPMGVGGCGFCGAGSMLQRAGGVVAVDGAAVGTGVLPHGVVSLLAQCLWGGGDELAAAPCWWQLSLLVPTRGCCGIRRDDELDVLVAVGGIRPGVVQVVGLERRRGVRLCGVGLMMGSCGVQGEKLHKQVVYQSLGSPPPPLDLIPE